MTADRQNVLFLCGGNSCRSQMGEAFLRKHGGDLFDAYSAGLEPAGEVHPLTVRVLEEKGLDVSGHRSKPASEYRGRLPVHTLVVVCDAAAKSCPSRWPDVRERLVWPFEDPAAFTGSEEERLEKFREVRDRIEARVVGWLAEVQAARTGKEEGSKMLIEVFGPGCPKCDRSAETARAFLAGKGIEGEVVKHTDLETMVERGVLLTPAVFADGEKVSEGRVLRERDLEAWLARRGAP